MLKTLLITTLVAVGCVLSSGVGADYFGEHFKFERMEAKGSPDSQNLPTDTIDLELFIRDDINSGSEAHEVLEGLLRGGGRVIVRLSRQDDGNRQRYGRLTLFITNSTGTENRQIELTLLDSVTRDMILLEYTDDLWANIVNEQGRESALFAGWYPNQVFAESVMLHIEATIMAMQGEQVDNSQINNLLTLGGRSFDIDFHIVNPADDNYQTPPFTPPLASQGVADNELSQESSHPGILSLLAELLSRCFRNQSGQVYQRMGAGDENQRGGTVNTPVSGYCTMVSDI